MKTIIVPKWPTGVYYHVRIQRLYRRPGEPVKPVAMDAIGSIALEREQPTEKDTHGHTASSTQWTLKMANTLSPSVPDIAASRNPGIPGLRLENLNRGNKQMPKIDFSFTGNVMGAEVKTVQDVRGVIINVADMSADIVAEKLESGEWFICLDDYISDNSDGAEIQISDFSSSGNDLIDDEISGPLRDE